MSLPFVYTHHGRRPATAITVGLVWAALIAAYWWLDAAPFVIAILGAFTLPALYDLLANPVSDFSMDRDRLRWSSGNQSAEIAVSQIDHLRFDTRLDMSVRLTVVRPSGIKIRVPFAATPPHAAFEKIAQEAGLVTRRHHFSLIN